MRDFPIFTTTHGVASLTLKEIPYNGDAYITVRDTSEPRELVEECLDFCRTVGAKRVFGTGHSVLEEYPLYSVILKMRVAVESLPEFDAALFPVTEETLEQWRDLYNEKMASVPNAATMTKTDAKDMLERGEGYFVHKDGKLLGIGMVGKETIKAIAAVEPGAGEQVLCTLCHGLMHEYAELEVAAENTRAMRLYERLGFMKTAEVSRWYKIFDDVK